MANSSKEGETLDTTSTLPPQKSSTMLVARPNTNRPFKTSEQPSEDHTPLMDANLHPLMNRNSAKEGRQRHHLGWSHYAGVPFVWVVSGLDGVDRYLKHNQQQQQFPAIAATPARQIHPSLSAIVSTKCPYCNDASMIQIFLNIVYVVSIVSPSGLLTSHAWMTCCSRLPVRPLRIPVMSVNKLFNIDSKTNGTL
jgi:hypothetical protein